MMFNILQFPVKAGHEFILSTNDQYKDICDDKVMYVDYVSTSHIVNKGFYLTLGYRKICQRSRHPASSYTLTTASSPSSLLLSKAKMFAYAH